MARTVIGNMENVEVCSFRGLVTAFARQREARVIIRGLRAVSDFEYEFQMAGMNRQLNDQTETVFLMPSEHLSYISSSLVREVASLGGDVSKFVHREVMEALRNRLVPQ
jgi:pantetheine-phosphate adenylyltransferase